jgi:acetamidase/formamidase
VKAYPPKDREKTIKLDLFGDAKYKLPKEMPEWEDKYNELSQTVASRLLKAARNKVEDIIKFFNESSQLDSSEAFKVTSTMAKVGSLMETLNKLEKEVWMEEQSGKTVRGGYGIGRYEVPQNKL